MSRQYARALEGFLADMATGEVRTTRFGPKTGGPAIAELSGVPEPEMTTWVTIGMARHERSSWRGLPLGYELVLTLADRDRDAVEMVKEAALEDRRRGLRRVDRRPVVEHNGAWAPGHPPHLVFIDSPLLRELMRKHKLGDRYVRFLGAVAVGDAEMRRYDRDPGRFVRQLAESGEVARYPR